MSFDRPLGLAHTVLQDGLAGYSMRCAKCTQLFDLQASSGMPLQGDGAVSASAAPPKPRNPAAIAVTRNLRMMRTLPVVMCPFWHAGALAGVPLSHKAVPSRPWRPKCH